MVSHSTLGASQGCSSKWDGVRTELFQAIHLLKFIQLKKSYNVVARLKANTSGFSWSETGGLNITINEACAWNEYIVVRTVGCVSPVFH